MCRPAEGHGTCDDRGMTEREHLEEYLAICKAVFEQMRRDGTWPWAADSTNPEDVLDSESIHHDV